MGIVADLTKSFNNEFHDDPLIIRSPGRVNIIGEHTDYNEGFVLPAAIDKAAYLAISLRDDDVINMIAKDLNEKFSIKLKDLKPIGDISWPNYILGVVAQWSGLHNHPRQPRMGEARHRQQDFLQFGV